MAITTILHTLLSLAWILIMLAMAGLSFWRFRGSPSGLLLPAGFVAWGLKLLLFVITGFVLPRMVQDVASFYLWQSVASAALGAVVSLVIIAGIAMLPRSLDKLEGRR